MIWGIHGRGKLAYGGSREAGAFGGEGAHVLRGPRVVGEAVGGHLVVVVERDAAVTLDGAGGEAEHEGEGLHAQAVKHLLRLLELDVREENLPFLMNSHHMHVSFHGTSYSSLHPPPSLKT
jgi:hypothetical protein